MQSAQLLVRPVAVEVLVQRPPLCTVSQVVVAAVVVQVVQTLRVLVALNYLETTVALVSSIQQVAAAAVMRLWAVTPQAQQAVQVATVRTSHHGELVRQQTTLQQVVVVAVQSQVVPLELAAWQARQAVRAITPPPQVQAAAVRQVQVQAVLGQLEKCG